MLCHWIKHLKSLQAYCKLKFNFESNYFGHNSYRHLKNNITPHTNPHHTQVYTCAPPTPHKHSKYHHNMNMCTLLSTYHTFTLDFWQKKKNNVIFFFKPNTYNKRVRQKEILVSSGVDGKPVNSEWQGATGQA
jgi:hypothetical protein